jgi:hypothetical protein
MRLSFSRLASCFSSSFSCLVGVDAMTPNEKEEKKKDRQYLPGDGQAAR